MEDHLDKYGDTIIICRDNMSNPPSPSTAGYSTTGFPTEAVKRGNQSSERVGGSLEIAETLKGGNTDGESSPRWIKNMKEKEADV